MSWSDAARERRRLKQEQRRWSGLCVNCGVPCRPYTRCETHREQGRRAYRQKQAFTPVESLERVS